MGTHIIGERRREPRLTPTARAGRSEPHIPGVRVVEVIDASAHGLRCRIAHAVRPGRVMPVKLGGPAGRDVQQALVVRCEVCRLTRVGVQYEAAFSLEQPWQW